MLFWFVNRCDILAHLLLFLFSFVRSTSGVGLVSIVTPDVTVTYVTMTYAL
jgi:hypothetical protein